MPTSYTSLLGLALPVTGELSGTWGDTVNQYITQYLDSAVEGTQTISGSQTSVTLSVTNGTSLSQVGSGSTGSAQYAIINCTGNPASTLTITAPASSRQYLVLNSTSTSQSVTFRGSGPTTGVTLVSGERCIVAWNGSDFVKIATSTADGVTTFSAGTTGFTPSTATSGAVTLGGTLATTNGGTGLTSFTANGVVYASSTSALTTGSALSFNGTSLTIGSGSGSPFARINGGTAAGLGGGYAIDRNGTEIGGVYSGSWYTSGSAAVNTVALGTTTAEALLFGINYAEQMRLTSTGLGIGTSSPAAKFQVGNGTGLQQAYISGGGYDLALGTSGGSLFGFASQAISGVFNTSSVPLGIGTNAAQPVVFGTANTERMRLDSSGNLGLGVTPSAWTNTRAFQVGGFGALSCDTATDGNVSLSWNAYATGASSWIYRANGAALRYTQDGAHKFFTAPSGTAGNAISFTQAMTLDASGNFYVGTTSQSGGSNITFNQPANADMKIAASVSTGTRAAYQVFINNAVTTVGTENSTGGSLASGTAAYATVLANNGAYPICFATNNTERARITSGGNVSIGGSADRGTTVGTAALQLFNGTAPAGTLTNGVSLYSSSGDLRFMDAAGNAYPVGFRNIPQSGSAKTGSYTLATTDVGEYIQVGSGGSITIPDATFATGDVVSVFNNTTGNITITCSITTAYIAGTDSDKATMTLATRGVATILFISSTVCVVTGNVT